VCKTYCYFLLNFFYGHGGGETSEPKLESFPKSHGMRSGEYSGCGMARIWFSPEVLHCEAGVTRHTVTVQRLKVSPFT